VCYLCHSFERRETTDAGDDEHGDMSGTMHDSRWVFLTAFLMVAMTALTSLAARRLRVPQSILLVLVGAAVAFAPRFPRVALNPELVLLGLLPPLLYTSGVGMSWRGFKKNLRPIMLLAVGCVLFTASAVAAAMHWLLHLPWAVGFVLGAVVSPPDAVAPMAIARRLSVPKRILTVLEGEGLVNDATALILFSFAVGAVTTGGVSVLDAAATFAAVVVGEIVWGLTIGWIGLRLRAWTRDTEVEMILALLTPFAAFWPPHFLGGSGVLAAVAAGLYTSWNGPRLISPATRLQGFFVWGLAGYLVEGIAFFLTGLQSRAVLEGPESGEWPRMISAAVITTLVVIVVRFLWVFPASFVTPLWSRTPGAGFVKPSWQETFLLGFTGIRGVVSLVAALAVPELVGSDPFPSRDLILFVTFCVILVSLVGQGAALPKVIEFLELDVAGRAEAALAKQNEVSARIAGIEAALARLAELEAAGAASSSVANLRRHHEDRRTEFIQTGDATFDGAPVAQTAGIQLQLIAAERAGIAAQFAAGKLTDEARRRIERELDLEDSMVRHAADSATGQGFDDG
jgi:CPA1 family monovalent cation:H+ antiporter